MTEAAQPSSPANAAAFSAREDDVFARIAGRYDALCDLFSLGIHRLWKARMAAEIARHRDAVILDAASGTGDIPARVLKLRARPRTLWVTDICPQMLRIAEAKVGGGAIARLAEGDAEALSSFPDSSVDVYSISFGMKICDDGE